MSVVFFFNDTATTEIYTLSLHDALPIYGRPNVKNCPICLQKSIAACLFFKKIFFTAKYASFYAVFNGLIISYLDRKSTRLNSSHANISYAVFCLKKKKHPIMTSQLLITH